MSGGEGDVWAVLCANLHALLTAQPARLNVNHLAALSEAVGVPLHRLMADDFDVSEVPWLPVLELVDDAS